MKTDRWEWLKQRRGAAWVALAACLALPLAGWRLAAARSAVLSPGTAGAQDPAPGAEGGSSPGADLGHLVLEAPRLPYRPPAEPPPLIDHVVLEGENIWLIALAYGTDMESIAAINGMDVADVLQPGQTLRVLVGTEGLVHTVADGDTVAALAERFDIRPEAIEAANRLGGRELAAGEEIILPGARMPQRRTVAVASVSRGGGQESGGGAVAGLVWPHVGPVTSPFGWRDGLFHTGTDIGGTTGDPIVAAAAGTVTHAGWGWSGFGIYVVLDHGDGTKTLYAHLDEAYVEEGMFLEQGDVLGALGSTGWSTGPHLHFEVIVNGRELDPLISLP